MLASLLYLIIILVIVGVILWAINNYIPMSPGIKKLINVLVIVVCAIIVIYWLFGFIQGSPPLFPHHRY